MTPLEPMNVNREALTASGFGSRPFTAADCVGCIVAFTIIAAPFNAMVAVPFGGELSTEAYFMIQLAFVPIIVPILIGSYPTSTSRNLLILAGLILTSIMVSFLANYSNIMGDAFRGRSAFEKMTSSAAVILFGIYFANVVYVAALANINRYFVHPLAIAVCLVLIVGAAQLIAIAAPGTKGFYSAAFGFVHAANRAGEITSGRVHGPLFEPAAFGSYMVYVLPWQIYLWLSSKRLFVKSFYFSLVVASLGLCVFSGTLAFGGALGIVCLYPAVYLAIWLERPFLVIGMLIVVYLLPLFALLTFDNEIAEMLIRSNSNSSLTRFGTIATLLHQFQESPLFGVGIGQYAFHLYNNIPPWAYTWEFRRWMTDPTASFFPTFSVFARVAGELGIVGIFVWSGSFLWISWMVTLQALRVRRIERKISLLGVTIIVCCFSIGINGWGEASFRGFGLWSAIGIALAYLHNANLGGVTRSQN